MNCTHTVTVPFHLLLTLWKSSASGCNTYSLSSNCLNRLGKTTQKNREFNAHGENILKWDRRDSKDIAGKYFSLPPPNELDWGNVILPGFSGRHFSWQTTSWVLIHLYSQIALILQNICFPSFSPQLLLPPTFLA